MTHSSIAAQAARAKQIKDDVDGYVVSLICALVVLLSIAVATY